MRLIRWLSSRLKQKELEIALYVPDMPEGNYVLLLMYSYYNNLIGTHLERAGFIVRKTQTVESALAQARVMRPSLIVLLIGPSVPKNVDLLQILAFDDKLSGIPVMGVVEEGYASLARASSLDACFTIPFVPSDLVQYAKRIMGVE